MGLLILSTAFFGNNIINIALLKCKELCDEKKIDFTSIQDNLMKSQTIEEFKEKFDKHFKDDLSIHIYKSEKK